MSKELKKILWPIAGDIKKVHDRIGELIYTGVPLIDESSMHLFQGGGKAVRAALVILSAGLKGQKFSGVLDLAAAVEIIHGASLIHDDIIDRASLRRGVQSVHEKFGSKIAANHEDKRVLLSITRASNELVKGELLQLEYSSLDKINEERYFEIINKKTGQLMAAAVEIGAYAGGFSQDEVNALSGAGLALGYAFQIIDDIMDYTADSKISGKAAGNDYLDGKITLPLIYALKRGTSKDVKLLKEILAKPDENRFMELRDLIEQSGALEYSRERARRYSRKALSVVSRYGSTGHGKIFCELIDFVTERNY